MTHTKEPWSYDKDLMAIIVVRDHKVRAVADFGKCELSETEANAHRIVACVNACEGIPTEQLEFDGAAFIALLKEREVFKQQRDELVAALEHIANESLRNLGSARIIARGALAKVSGKEQTT